VTHLKYSQVCFLIQHILANIRCFHNMDLEMFQTDEVTCHVTDYGTIW